MATVASHRKVYVLDSDTERAADLCSRLRYLEYEPVIPASGARLADDDGITSLQVMPAKSKRGYIPYTNKRLLWHTDGYYNDESRKVRAFVLHCVRDAASGGETALLDPEILYIRLRDDFPDLLRALCGDDAFSIPADHATHGSGRPAFTGPVFSVDRAFR